MEQPEEVADVVQEVFVRLCENDWRLLRAFRPERSAFTTWLTMVARSVAIDWLRRRRPPAASLDEVDDPVARLAASAEAIELPPGLLSRRQQLVLRLLFDQDLSVEEVAGVLGVAPQTVRSTKHNAISALRAHYGVSPSGRPARRGSG
jgi:RNA polymerase sigma-70 factor (ECF subfamily)